MPQYEHIPLVMIDAPQRPVRVEMDETLLHQLAESMRTEGLAQPIGLVKLNGRYEVKFGHRRFTAAGMLKWAEIPALVYEPYELDNEALMLHENLHREDITAAEEAILFAQHIAEDNLDEAGVMARFGVSQDYLGDRMRLLHGDEKVFDAILHRRISFTVGRELNKCSDESMRRYYLDAAVRGEHGARTVAQWIRDWKHNASATATAPAEVVPVEQEAQPVVNPVRCFLCGGDKDPWNLEAVYVHKHERAQMEAVMEQLAKGETA